MDTALNKTLAALPDDTKVFVGHETVACPVKADSLPAWPRVHQRQRQIRHKGHAVGADQETGGICEFEQADPGQVHDWGREAVQRFHEAG